MLKRNTDVIIDVETKAAIEFILEEGLGKAIELDAVPTATVPLLSADEWGIYSGILYFRKANIVYVVAPSSTITVT